MATPDDERTVSSLAEHAPDIERDTEYPVPGFTEHTPSESESDPINNVDDDQDELLTSEDGFDYSLLNSAIKNSKSVFFAELLNCVAKNKNINSYDKSSRTFVLDNKIQISSNYSRSTSKPHYLQGIRIGRRGGEILIVDTYSSERNLIDKDKEVRCYDIDEWKIEEVPSEDKAIRQTERGMA